MVQGFGMGCQTGIYTVTLMVHTQHLPASLVNGQHHGATFTDCRLFGPITCHQQALITGLLISRPLPTAPQKLIKALQWRQGVWQSPTMDKATSSLISMETAFCHYTRVTSGSDLLPSTQQGNNITADISA